MRGGVVLTALLVTLMDTSGCMRDGVRWGGGLIVREEDGEVTVKSELQ